ncbi:DUF1643 domain-containing protein [Polaribacter atrinae]|uniref:DUF1643 domain-containing protein n=1 Tax=Polaribacter atrinae TaxID=1333662 RepID=A0A176TEF1_9FLAO|nr:DUF1643 domain-containing protein [Polaribacter atrinae]OAD46011.1 hypothetical protein LPB303_03590 [Polaribacter atrinae]
MKKQYKITGLYYQTQGFNFRKYLDLKNVKLSCKTPDLMVIMMNPGGSYPLDKIDNNTTASEAIPDRTQSQVIQVMQNAGFNYARVLNLSDIREPKSNLFYDKIAELDTKGIAHSIFDDTRKEDLSQLWVNTATVIYGWGVSNKLKPLALKAIAACNASNPYGILKAGTNWAYYHPLPPIHSKQIEWVKEVSKQLKT